jgi:predicted  nucleic acid-binding Zn-ribbon protein
LVKVTAENVALEMEYNKFMKEQDEATQKVERMQQEFEKVYQELLEAHTKMEASIEEQVTNTSKSIQGFHARIVNLEAHMTPNTPLEEREKRE